MDYYDGYGGGGYDGYGGYPDGYGGMQNDQWLYDPRWAQYNAAGANFGNNCYYGYGNVDYWGNSYKKERPWFSRSTVGHRNGGVPLDMQMKNYLLALQFTVSEIEFFDTLNVITANVTPGNIVKGSMRVFGQALPKYWIDRISYMAHIVYGDTEINMDDEDGLIAHLHKMKIPNPETGTYTKSLSIDKLPAGTQFGKTKRRCYISGIVDKLERVGYHKEERVNPFRIYNSNIDIRKALGNVNPNELGEESRTAYERQKAQLNAIASSENLSTKGMVMYDVLNVTGLYITFKSRRVPKLAYGDTKKLVRVVDLYENASGYYRSIDEVPKSYKDDDTRYKIDTIMEILAIRPIDKELGVDEVMIKVSRDYARLLGRYMIVATLRRPENHLGMMKIITINGTRVYVVAKQASWGELVKYSSATERIYEIGFEKSTIESRLYEWGKYIFQKLYGFYFEFVGPTMDFVAVDDYVSKIDEMVTDVDDRPEGDESSTDYSEGE